MTQRYEQAKEQITKILIQEYCKKNPDVNENEVIVKCQDGTLIFTDVAAVLAELKVRKNYQKALEHAGKMYSSLAAHENQRWKDCVESTEHTRMMIDCLHSSPFLYYTSNEWREIHEFLNEQEQLCAKITVYLEDCRIRLSQLKRDEIHNQFRSKRAVVVDFLNWVIEQLRVVHRVCKKEVEIGEHFAEKANQFIEFKFQNVEKQDANISLDYQELDRIYQSIKGDANQSLHLKYVRQLNIDVLRRTKQTLSNAVDELKAQLQVRREQFQQVWTAISQMNIVVDKVNELNQKEKSSQILSLSEKFSQSTSKKRMVRYEKRERI